MYSAALCFTQDHAHVNNFVEACHALAAFKEESPPWFMTCLIRGDPGATSRDDVIYIFLGKAIVLGNEPARRLRLGCPPGVTEGARFLAPT